MMWPFKTKAPTATSFPVGIYKLDAPITGLTGLVEFSPSEYATMGRVFEGERNFNAPRVDFLGKQWKVMLQTVNGQICKIAPFLLLASKQEANPIAMETLNYCTQKLGKPSEQRTGFFVWDTTDGNVILQTDWITDGWSIAFFLTSKSVSNFKLLPDSVAVFRDKLARPPWRA